MEIDNGRDSEDFEKDTESDDDILGHELCCEEVRSFTFTFINIKAQFYLSPVASSPRRRAGAGYNLGSRSCCEETFSRPRL